MSRGSKVRRPKVQKYDKATLEIQDLSIYKMIHAILEIQDLKHPHELHWDKVLRFLKFLGFSAIFEELHIQAEYVCVYGVAALTEWSKSEFKRRETIVRPSLQERLALATVNSKCSLYLPENTCR